MNRLLMAALCIFHLCSPLGRANPAGAWEETLLQDLCARYGISDAGDGRALDRLSAAIGRRLAGGPDAVPAGDVARLALLLAGRTRPETPYANGGSPLPQSPASAPPQTPAQDRPISDIQKGNEGFRQGVERLRQLPATERFVITGDITSGMQAATVPGNTDLTSMFGRARVNVVARAVPASASGLFSEGHFFLQLQAAGGPFDSSPVGGPSPFSPLNDVATRRSRFNEGLSRGNLYLGKTFYQQDLRLGDDRVTGRIGVVDLTDFFDTNAFANNESRQFLSSAFANSAGFNAGLVAPGLMGEYRRKMDRDWLDGLVLRFGSVVSRTDRAFTSPISTAETELNTIWHGLRGNWRVGGTLGNVAGVGGVQGIHFSADQWLSQRMGVFGRYAHGGTGRGSLALSPVSQSYSGGIQWRFVDQDDRVSAFAVGFSQAFPINPDGTLRSERIFETYYRWQVTENFSLTPDLQLVIGSGGRKNNGTQVVIGLRTFFGL